MDFRDVRGPGELPQYLREFVNVSGDPVPYDFGWAVAMLAALLDNLRVRSLEVELEEVSDRLTDEQRMFLAKLAACANRGAGPEP
jgi:hypothetical protein